MKDDVSQKMHGNMIFFVYMYKYCKYDIILPPKIAKMIFSRKNTLKADISNITENDNIYPKKYGIPVEIPYWLTF